MKGASSALCITCFLELLFCLLDAAASFGYECSVKALGVLEGS